MTNKCEICLQSKAVVIMLPWKKSMMVVCQQQCLGALLRGAKVPVRSAPHGRFMAMDENRNLVQFEKVAPNKTPQKAPSQWITSEEADKLRAVDGNEGKMEIPPKRGLGRPRKVEPVAVGQQV